MRATHLGSSSRRVLAAGLLGLSLAAGSAGAAAAGPVGPDGQSAGLGCAAQCIVGSTTTVGPFAATLGITTDTPATVEVQISTAQAIPGGSGQPPWFTAPMTQSSNTLATSHAVTFVGLSAGTSYYAVVLATDADGQVAWAQGSFRTAARNVVIGFDRVEILDDADAGPDPGEISLAYSVDGSFDAGFGTMKLSDGDVVHLDKAAALHDVKQYATVSAVGVECDNHWTGCPIEALPTASTKDMDVARISQVIDLDRPSRGALPPGYGHGAQAGHDGYFQMTTVGTYLRYTVYGWWDVSYG